MTRYGLLAAVPLLALCAPAIAQVPPAPVPLTPPPGESVAIPPDAMAPAPPASAVAPGKSYTEISAPASLLGGDRGGSPQVAVRVDPATGATIETIVLPPGTRPPPQGEGIGAITLTSTPDFVWVPGHYNWDPVTQRYVWLVGQYLQAPRPDAHWVDGHWQLTDTRYAWIDGHFE